MCLELGEGHLDRIEVWRVGRQEEEPGASALQAFGGFGALVDGEVVENDHIARRQGRSELGFDPKIEGCPIDRLVDHPRRCQLIAAKASDKGLGSPMAEGCIGAQPLTTRRAASKPHHLRVDRGLIDKDETMRLETHSGLAAIDPETAFSLDIGACAFRRHQRFFYK